MIFRLRKYKRNKLVNTYLGECLYGLGSCFLKIEKVLPVFEPIDVFSIIFNPV